MGHSQDVLLLDVYMNRTYPKTIYNLFWSLSFYYKMHNKKTLLKIYNIYTVIKIRPDYYIGYSTHSNI